jgi:hypothetical protein
MGRTKAGVRDPGALAPAVPDTALLAECEVHTYRASGPGGQKRNKTESAVRLHHKPSGIRVVATESRSQHENKVRALRRLRRALALRVRQPVTEEGPPDAVVACIGGHGRLSVGQRDARYLACAGAVLDVLHALEGNVSASAERIGVSTGNLSAFLTGDEDVMAEANRTRASFGLRPLRR